jgi:hypothetical protein
MSIFADLLVLIFGCLVFLFFFWRRLKEDYSSSLIFSSGLTIIVAVLIGVGLSKIFSGLVRPGKVFVPRELWFWGGYLGFLAGFGLALRRFKIKSVETFEAGVLGLLFLLLLVYIKSLSLVFVLATVAVLLIFRFFESKYRRFGWYKSGRVGFSGLAAAGIFFLARMIISVSVPGATSVVGKVDLVLSGVSAFLLFFSLYNLSESN